MKTATTIRIGIVAAGLVALEILCQTGTISRFVLIPPSAMVTGLVSILMTGTVTADIVSSVSAIIVAAIASIVVGFIAGVILHAVPRVRRVINPVLTAYYSVPIFVFYPIIIVFFGLNNGPKVVMGFMLAVVAMLTNTLNGLDRVPRVLHKTAAVLQLDRRQTAMLIVLPCAAPSIFAGLKLAVAYSFLGVLGAEFILSSSGIGYQIAFAFTAFDNVTMYSLILFVLIMVSAVNSALFAWERHILNRRALL